VKFHRTFFRRPATIATANAETVLEPDFERVAQGNRQRIYRAACFVLGTADLHPALSHPAARRTAGSTAVAARVGTTVSGAAGELQLGIEVRHPGLFGAEVSRYCSGAVWADGVAGAILGLDRAHETNQ
jgi:hypothetical protein